MAGTTCCSLVGRIRKENPRTVKELLDMALEEAGAEEAVDAMFPPDRVKEKARRDEEPGAKVGPSHRRDKKKKRDKRVVFVAAADPKPTRPQGWTPQGQRRDARPQGRRPAEG